MENTFPTLFQVNFYREDTTLLDQFLSHTDYEVIPTTSCLTAMAKYNLLFRTTARGVSILKAKKENKVESNLFSTFLEPVKFRFHLKLDSKVQTEYSEFTQNGNSPSIYYFSNFSENIIQGFNGDDSVLLLTKDKKTPFISQKDQLHVRNSLFIYEHEDSCSMIELKILNFEGKVVYSKNVPKIENKFRCFIDLSENGTGHYSILINGEVKDKFYVDSLLSAQMPFGIIEIFSHPMVPKKYQFVNSRIELESKNYSVCLAPPKGIKYYNINMAKKDKTI